MDFWFTLLAFLSTLVSAVWSGWQLSQGKFRKKSLNILFLGAAFLSLFVALVVRGEVEQGCPLNDATDLLLFLSWGILGFYLVAGSALRMSLLGYFTAPLATLLLLVALFPGVWSAPQQAASVRTAWIELHASLSVLAYAGFALAAISAVMFLLLHGQLKHHKLQNVTWKLPPLHHLSDALLRLLVCSEVLLTVGIVAGLIEWQWQVNPKIIVALGVWGLYAVCLLLRFRAWLHSRRFAQVALLGFCVSLLSLWLVERAY